MKTFRSRSHLLLLACLLLSAICASAEEHAKPSAGGRSSSSSRNVRVVAGSSNFGSRKHTGSTRGGAEKWAKSDRIDRRKDDRRNATRSDPICVWENINFARAVLPGLPAVVVKWNVQSGSYVCLEVTLRGFQSPNCWVGIGPVGGNAGLMSRRVVGTSSAADPMKGATPVVGWASGEHTRPGEIAAFLSASATSVPKQTENVTIEDGLASMNRDGNELTARFARAGDSGRSLGSVWPVKGKTTVAVAYHMSQTWPSPHHSSECGLFCFSTNVNGKYGVTAGACGSSTTTTTTGTTTGATTGTSSSSAFSTTTGYSPPSYTTTGTSVTKCESAETCSDCLDKGFACVWCPKSGGRDPLQDGRCSDGGPLGSKCPAFGKDADFRWGTCSVTGVAGRDVLISAVSFLVCVWCCIGCLCCCLRAKRLDEEELMESRARAINSGDGESVSLLPGVSPATDDELAPPPAFDAPLPPSDSGGFPEGRGGRRN